MTTYLELEDMQNLGLSTSTHDTIGISSAALLVLVAKGALSSVLVETVPGWVGVELKLCQLNYWD